MPNFKTKLLQTDNRIIAEAAPRDCIWGIGLGNTPKIQDFNVWRGTNILGITLMLVRLKLREPHNFPNNEFVKKFIKWESNLV